ncbi:uncharacterized protein LOC126966964 [Leptidea sinapis]|uniref:uncharacterized protein LOC126966964 n=1 Tax=Leptidea sinapis TaxID=189913 RepID=UPI0021C29071|nr:uncharacterized protein LOC126966964 [Leptidea sinapis]
MMTCSRCGDEATETIKCSVCTKQYDFECSGITERGYRRFGDRQASWRCPACKNPGNLSVVTPTPVSSPISPSSISLETIMQELTSINLKLAPLSSLVADMQVVKKELSDLKASASEYSKKISSLEANIARVEKDQECLQPLKVLVTKLEEELADKDQWLRSNNVEIKGVPITDKENLFDVVNKIGNKISCPVSKDQINFVHRVHTGTNNVKNIVLSFTNRYSKENFVAAARSVKDRLTPQDIEISGSGKIFVNDHLTTRNKMLLTKTKALASQHNFQFVWVKHSRIFVRRDSTSKSFTIQREQDIQKIR